jgi:uncharacterized protein involved in exopolysaccharide biosynthesis
MKYILLLLLISGTAFSQVKIDYVNGQAVVQHIIDAPDKSAQVLYEAVNRWVVERYVNPENVITAKIDNELVKGRGAVVKGVNISGGVRSNLQYIFTIDVKDEKIRYTMNNMQVGTYAIETYLYKSDGSMRTNAQANAINESVTDIARALIISLENQMKLPSKKDDW